MIEDSGDQLWEFVLEVFDFYIRDKVRSNQTSSFSNEWPLLKYTYQVFPPCPIIILQDLGEDLNACLVLTFVTSEGQILIH